MINAAALERAEAVDYEDAAEMAHASRDERRRCAIRLKRFPTCESCARRESKTTTRISLDRQPIAVCDPCRRERISLRLRFNVTEAEIVPICQNPAKRTLSDAA